MNRDALKELLQRVSQGQLSAEEAAEELKDLPFSDLGFARVDNHRELRNGIPEVIFAEGKDAGQIIGIARSMVERGQGVLVTRLDADKAEELSAALDGFSYNSTARISRRGGCTNPSGTVATVAVVSAGTSDQAVAEEATETLAFLGIEVVRSVDVGVAGIHRLLADRRSISEAAVAIVVAGMEGALPSVVGGLVDLPVIAVPTSVGYGSSFGGLAALLAMLNSCAAGVTVVNIDNGFGAAVAAAAIIRSGRRVAAGD
ncbi:MAG: nickel pincer cofactor biosynthesis protein LarB [Deltaproteobacteria bacterium]